MIFKDINIKELFQLMQEHDIAETTLQDGKAMVVVKRQKEPVILNADAADRPYDDTSAPHAAEVLVKQSALPQTEVIEELGLEKHASPGEEPENGYHKIVAPLVGTFYMSPAPEDPPFVEVGDHIDTNDVVCIVEAMKSMNEIQSDVKGVVKEICVENAQMVEFGQVLFKIDSSG